jgi:hypothetical protein
LKKIGMGKVDSRKRSLIETMGDIALGFMINFTLNMIILPPYADGIARSDTWTLLQIGLWFTVVALVRRYAVRRLFENLKKKKWRNRIERIGERLWLIKN